MLIDSINTAGRNVAGCCKVSDSPPRGLQCTKTTCEIDAKLCSDTLDEYGVPVLSSHSKSLNKRLQKGYKWTTLGAAAMVARGRPYPTGAAYMRLLNQGLRGLYERYFRLQGSDCPRRDVQSVRITTEGRPPNGEVEHAVPVRGSHLEINCLSNLTPQLMLTSRFPAVANHGRSWTQRPMGNANRIPIGPATRTPAIANENFWRDVWDNPTALSARVERLTETSPQIRTPSELFAEAFGSTSNPSNFVFLEMAVNRAKGRIEGFRRNIADDTLEDMIDNAVSGNENAANEILETFAEVGDSPSIVDGELTVIRLRQCLHT